jgi:hypothetical protein
MPTVHRDHGLKFVVYIDDHPPPHIHVTGRGIAKVALEPAVALLHSRSLSKADIGRILEVVRSQRSMMLEAWNRIHG